MVLNASTAIVTVLPNPREAILTSLFSSRYFAILVLIVLAVWCWVDVWPRGRLDPTKPNLHRTDFTVYTNAGKAALAGLDPYSVSNARGWKYLYLPPFALLVSPLASLSEGWQCVIWFWISIACLFGAFREFTLLDLWAFPGDGYFRLNLLAVWGGILCLIGFSLSTLNCLQRGQVGVFQLYLTLLGVRMILTNATAWSALVGGSVLAGAIILKLSPALPATVLIGSLVFLGLRKCDHSSVAMLKRALATTIGLIAGLVVGIWILPASLVGWERNQTYLESWRRDVFARTNELSNDPFAGDSHSTKNQSPMNAFWHLGNRFLNGKDTGGPTHSNSEKTHPMDQPFGKQVQSVVRVVSILATGIALFAILWRGDSNALLVAFAVANAATLLVVPIARGHYFMAIWPASVWVPRWLMQSMPVQTPFRLGIGWLAPIPPALLLVHYLFERYVGAWGLLGVGIWLWNLLLTGVVLVTVFSAPERRLAQDARGT